MFFLDSIFTILSWRTFFDITFVAVVFYQIISMLKGTRAAQILIGMLVIFVAYVFSGVLQFETLHWIISKFYSSFIIVVIVLFQDDIRRLLTRFGRGPFINPVDAHSGTHVIDEVINAAKALSHERIGALIVFERAVGLDRLHDHSVKLDSYVSEQLLASIFQSFSPLHDGAVIIQKVRISCASAQLPLSKNPRFSKKLGTRHSAAVGISEETDAVVLVVSEETGSISIAWEGNLQRQTNIEAARKMLNVLLLPRGDRVGFLNWVEDNFNYRIAKFLNFFKLKNSSHETKKTEEKKYSYSSNQSNENLNLQQVESENKTAANSLKNIHLRLPNNAKIQHLAAELAYITSHDSLNSQNKSFSITNESLQNEKLNKDLIGLKEQLLNQAFEESGLKSGEKNEALKAIVELAPEDRFDPPIPKSLSPRNISIGGIPLTPPIEPSPSEKKLESLPNKDKEKNDKEKSE